MKILFTVLLFISNCIYAQVDTLDDQIDTVALFENIYEKVHPDTIKNRTFVIDQIFKEPKFTFTIDAWGCFSGKYIDYMFIQKDGIYDLIEIIRNPDKPKSVISKTKKTITKDEVAYLKELFLYAITIPNRSSCTSEATIKLKSKNKHTFITDDDCWGLVNRFNTILGLE